jgi:hypothetical protein
LRGAFNSLNLELDRERHEHARAVEDANRSKVSF